MLDGSTDPPPLGFGRHSLLERDSDALEAQPHEYDGFKWKKTDGSGVAVFELPAEQDHWIRMKISSPRHWLSRYKSIGESLSGLSLWTHIPAGTDAAAVTLTTPETASVTFEVTYGGAPLPRASLALSWAPHDQESVYSKVRREATPNGERTDGAGLWSRSEMLPGKWTATVYHPHLRMPERFEFALHPGEQTVRLDRHRAAVEGRVLDPGGLPIAGALVRPSRGYESPVRAIYERDNHRMSPRPGGHKDDLALRDIRYVRTDATGYFRLEGIEPGVRVKAVVMAPGFIIATSTFAKLDPGEVVDLGEITMERGGRIEVLIPIGMEGAINLAPIVDETEDDEDVDFPSEERWSSIFDSESVDGLRPGPWSLIIEFYPASDHDDVTQHTATLEIGAGETIVIDLRR